MTLWRHVMATAAARPASHDDVWVCWANRVAHTTHIRVSRPHRAEKPNVHPPSCGSEFVRRFGGHRIGARRRRIDSRVNLAVEAAFVTIRVLSAHVRTVVFRGCRGLIAEVHERRSSTTRNARTQNAIRFGTPVAFSRVDAFAVRDGVLCMARKPGALISAAGPVLLLPKAADPFLGPGKWGAGRRSQTGARRAHTRRTGLR
jgi:hypothetical protein